MLKAVSSWDQHFPSHYRIVDHTGLCSHNQVDWNRLLLTERFFEKSAIIFFTCMSLALFLSLMNSIFLVEIWMRCLLCFIFHCCKTSYLCISNICQRWEFQVLMTCFFSSPFVKISWFYILAKNSCKQRCLLYIPINTCPFCFPSFMLTASIELPLSISWVSAFLYENQSSSMKQCPFRGF